MATMADFKKEIKVSEGSIPHMYLDTVGKVTVGVGNILPTVASAKKLAFVNRITKKRATDKEIEADYNTVKKQPKGLLVLSYKKHTKLDLPPSEIDKLLNSRISELKKGLKQKFSRFDSYPETAKMAMLDMAFNVGVNGVVTKFLRMKKAIEKSDWVTAAKESNRPQISKARNDPVKKWFNEAAKQKAEKEARYRVEEKAKKK